MTKENIKFYFGRQDLGLRESDCDAEKIRRSVTLILAMVTYRNQNKGGLFCGYL
jgi:hypothetical protein